MSVLLRPWSTIKREIEAEIAALTRELRATSDPHDYRHIQGRLDGLERALDIASRAPEPQPSAADDNLY